MTLRESDRTALERIRWHRKGLNTCMWRRDVQWDKIRSSIHPNIHDIVLGSGLTGEIEAAELPAQDWKRTEKVDKNISQRTIDKFADTVFHL